MSQLKPHYSTTQTARFSILNRIIQRLFINLNRIIRQPKPHYYAYK